MTLLKRPAFFRDLAACADYIARDNLEAARRLFVAAEETCDKLAKQPGIGHQEGFRRQLGIRSWRVDGFDNYLIFYRVKGDSVEVLRLLHAKRNLPRAIQRKKL
jgi:toxin ParE1/3/4